MEFLNAADKDNEENNTECQYSVDHKNEKRDTECLKDAGQHEGKRKASVQESMDKKRKNEWVRGETDIANLVPPSEEDRQELDSMYVQIPAANFKDIILNTNEFLDDVCLEKCIYVLRRRSIFDVLSVQCLINPRFIRP